MPDLHSYGIDQNNELSDFVQGEQFSTPMDTYLKTRFDRGMAYGTSALGLNMLEKNYLDNTDTMYDPDTLEPVQNHWLTGKEAKDKYGLLLHDNEKMSDFAAQKVAQLQEEDKQRNATIERASQDWFTQGLGFGAETVATLLDPINVGAAFIPIVGEAKALSLMQRFGPTVGRLMVGATEGAVGNAILEPFNYSFANSLHYDYDAYDSFLNIAAGGIVGAGLHAGIGKISDKLGISEWSKHLKEKIIDIEDHQNMIKTGVGQIVQDQNLNVAPIAQISIRNKFPNLDHLGGLKLIKSAEESADIFKHEFDKLEIIKSYRDDIEGLLTDAEKQVFNATSTTDIVEGQISLGKDILSLREQIDNIQNIINEGTNKEQLGFLSYKMASLSETLDEKQGIYDNLLETRKYIDELSQDLEKQIDTLEPEKRSKLENLNPQDSNFILNSEKYKDANSKILDKLDFNSIKNEVDKNLLRQALIKAQDLSKLDSITPEQLLDIATKQHSQENKWFSDSELISKINEQHKEIPVQYTETEADQSLKTVMESLTPEQLEVFKNDSEFKKLDENISEANSMIDIFKQAAQCIIEETL